MASDDAWSPPEELEEYRIVRLLGQGGMGRVYLAEDRLLERPVAVKFIAAGAPSEAARERFYVEARAVARLSHPNVVSVHRVGEIARRPFLVSEYVRGASLAELDKPVEPRRALAIGIGLARGLAAAHRAGVLHRDLKPANAVLSEDGTVKLLDFGLAELLSKSAVDAPRLDPPARALMPDDADATVSLGESRPPADPRSETAPPSPSGPRVAGTPRYMAPELWRGEPATTRSDVYALGVVLHELCTGAPPHGRPDLGALLLALSEHEAPPVLAVAPKVDPRLAAIIDRCVRRDPHGRFRDGEALREALEQIGERAHDRGPIPASNPYRGLLAFEEAHRDLFFGRGGEVRAILDRLRAEDFVVVAADSGAGKSSLCRAGVLPEVADGALGGDWSTAVAIPGRRPLRSLATALAPLLEQDPPEIEERLREDPEALGRDLRKRGAGRILIFVDQLEELLTLADPAESRAASEALHAILDAGGARLLAAARSDFLARLASLPGLGDALARALYLLRPLGTQQLREAVVEPARALGFSFASEAMVEALAGEAARAGGGLPLLQFALAELWEARDEAERVIPEAALAAIGGVGGALARHADGVVARLSPAHRTAARHVLLGLVTAEGTRVRRTEAEIVEATPDARDALEALVRGRLLVAREGSDGEGGSYEIAHEALLGGWATLRGWLGNDAEKRAIRERLARAAAEWERLGRASDALYQGRQLDETAGLDPADLGPRERAFLEASRRAATRRRIVRWAVGLGAPLSIVAAVWGTVTLQRRTQVAARIEAATLAMNEATAKRRETDGLRAEAFARFDANDADAGEQTWEHALKTGAEADTAYAKAGQELEAALRLDGGHLRARAMLSDALLARAELAERDHRAAQRDELLERLAVHDEDGSRRRRWAAPARVSITSSPPGAEAAIERVASKDGRRLPGPATVLGRTPLHDLAIAAGSVIFTFRGAGRAPVRLPVVLERDETRPLSIALPPAATIPEGFVYVPSGRFLSGSDDGERARQFLGGVPLHPIETGAYLIAQSETTFADWIAFLRALPKEERAGRTPRGTNNGFTLSLDVLPDGDYQLSFGPDGSPTRARPGEPFRYAGRSLRAAQPWLRFPVSGVSFEGALAYMAWLDRTGRVPGARLCDEREWERAARGADDRLFPGGDRLDADDANHDLTYGRNPFGFGPDEVGAHPASDSPFGIHDLAGNVWEWTTAFAHPESPVLRSGGWYQRSLDSMSANREPIEPNLRHVDLGIRVCATPRAP